MLGRDLLAVSLLSGMRFGGTYGISLTKRARYSPLLVDRIRTVPSNLVGTAALGRLILWGGSLAVTRRALEILDLPNTIGRTLTEDLPIGDIGGSAASERCGMRVSEAAKISLTRAPSGSASAFSVITRRCSSIMGPR
jgi:hypothetical protein